MGRAVDWNLNINITELLDSLPSSSWSYLIFIFIVTTFVVSLVYMLLHMIKPALVWLTAKISALIIASGLDAIISVITLLTSLFVAFVVAQQELIVMEYGYTVMQYMKNLTRPPPI